MAFTIQLDQLRTSELFAAERALRDAQVAVYDAYHSCNLDALCKAFTDVNEAKREYDKALRKQHRLIVDKAETIQ